MDFIYNSVGSTNGIDAFGHIVRSNLQLTSCVEVAVTVQSGCEAFFRPATTTPTTTKKKKGKKSVRKAARAHLRSKLPLPPVNVPDLSQLLPPASPDQGDQSDDSGFGADSGTTTTTPTTPSPDQGTDREQQPGQQATSMRGAAMFLNFLLGGGA
jgi:hypothetical protein